MRKEKKKVNIISENCENCTHYPVCSIAKTYAGLVSKIEITGNTVKDTFNPLSGDPNFYIRIGCNHYRERSY